MRHRIARWRSTTLASRESQSFSQCGEDRIVLWLFRVFGIEQPRYLDVGAHHPTRQSNTFLFHRLSGSGVLVEPNPRWAAEIRRGRPRDVCIEAAAGPEPQSGVPFYVMRSDTLSTLSKAEADRMVRECGEEIREVREIEVVAPSGIQRRHFGAGLNFVSLDVEGVELDVLRAFDFDANRPEVFCIETLSYATDGSGRKAVDLIAFMASVGYAVHADTYVNTIFVEEDRARGLIAPRGAREREA
ncbi:MAG: FkbM family methyltransferase [Myxococcota bacterium]